MLDDPSDPPPPHSALEVGQHDIRLELFDEGWPSIGWTPYAIALVVIAAYMFLGTLPEGASILWVAGLFALAGVGLVGLLRAMKQNRTSRVLVLNSEEIRIEHRVGSRVSEQKSVPILQLEHAGVEWLGKPNQYSLRLQAEGGDLDFRDFLFEQEVVEWMARRIMAVKEDKRASTRQLKVDRQRPRHINDMLIPGSLPK